MYLKYFITTHYINETLYSTISKTKVDSAANRILGWGDGKRRNRV